MRALVTGGSGFLGSHICDVLEERGHDVVVLDIVPPNSRREYFEADIREGRRLDGVMDGCEVVYHCAAMADLEASRRAPRYAIESNILGTLNVLEAAHESRVQRFMHASSVYVFSRGGSVYRTTKQAAENLVLDLAADWGLMPTNLRFGSLYGPRADSSNAILRLIRQALAERRIDFWGNGSEIREYIHIRDAAGLAVDALDERFVGQALHITGRERLTTGEIIAMINEILGGDLTISMHDEPFEGRYRLTPYSFDGNDGRRITSETYMDLGLGLLETIRATSEDLVAEDDAR